MDRRTVVRAMALGGVAGAVAGTGAILLPASAWASPEGVAKMLQELIGDRKPAPGKVKLDMPQIAENGNAVPLTVSVESPMTEASHVKAIHVLAEANPDPLVISFLFTPLSGKAEASVRMRLAQTQNILAVAEMSDGSVHMAKTEVKVTIGGCGG